MKIEQTPFNFTNKVSATPFMPQRPMTYTASELVSPHAPTFPRHLWQFFSNLWDWICSFFIKEEPPTAPPQPSEETLQLIEMTLAKEKAASATWLNRETAAIGLVGAAVCYWQWEKVSSFAISVPYFILSQIPSMIAIQTASYLSPRLEKKAGSYLPANMPPWMNKAICQTAVSAAIWYGCRLIGYPMGQAYLGYLSRATLKGYPSMAVPVMVSAATSYIEIDKLFWAITAFNIARYISSQTRTENSFQI